MRRMRPPSSRPAWRWLWALLIGGGALVAGTESLSVSAPTRGALELGIAMAATAGLLTWIRMNRAALVERDTLR
jgi:hypothetical protein